MRSIFRYITLLFPLFLIAGCQAEEKHKPKVEALPVVEVQAMKATAQEGHLQTKVVGTVRSVKQAVIAAKVTGTIEQLPVGLGSSVKTGDLLVKISAEEISAKTVQAQTQLEQAKRNLEREKKLLKKNAATAEGVKSLEENYRVAEAAHREAFTMLSYTTITAPFDGVITAKMSDAGDLATPGTPLLKLEDNTKLQVEASVPEGLILRIQSGDTMSIHIPVADQETQGTVAEVAPAADPLSRTATVKLKIDPHPLIRSGQFARVTIPGERKESLFIPSSAIHTFGQMEQIYVIKENKAHLRIIRTGVVLDDQVEILAGLDEGEIIAITNGSKLTDGQPVTIVK